MVLIISDDMGYADMPRFGESTSIPMPQMERLCREGVTLTGAYAPGPICVPSRMGIVTGRHPVRWGPHTNAYDLTALLQFQAEKTIAEYFKQAGYATGLFGKWHLSGDLEKGTFLLGNGEWASMPPESRPEAKGFDEIAIIPGGMAGYLPGTRLHTTGGAFIEAPECLTDYFGREAGDFIRRKKGEPFFLMVVFTAVHAPLHALDEDIKEFGSLDGYDRKRYVPHLAKEDREPRMDRQVYAGMMRGLDRSIGRVLDALDAAGVAGNTLVYFINDNGGPSLAAEVHSYNQASNHPYRGYKFDCLEGGIRVPMAMRWPGQLPANRTYSGIVSGMDILPTALTACGIPLPAATPMDGVDLLPFLSGSRSGHPHESLSWEVYLRDADTSGQAAIRQGNWKLHQYTTASVGPRLDQWALYDLSTDPGESADLAASYPQQVNRLDAAWREWKARIQPQADPTSRPGPAPLG